MEPRTKREKEVFNLSKRLKPHKRLLNKVLKEGTGKIYHVITEVIEDYQVFRYFRIDYHKRKPNTYWETQQLWYKDGEETLISRKRLMNFYYDCYSLSSDLEIRKNKMSYSYSCASMMPIYSIDIVALKPEWDRNLLENISSLYDIERLVNAMSRHPYIETMFKQHRELLYRMCNVIGLNDVIEYSPEIKVALRHGYGFNEISIWRDAMMLARQFNIETRNPYYCASNDIDALHDRLIKKRDKIKEETRIKEELSSLRYNLEKYSEKFYKHIKPYLDLTISDGEIEIRPLLSIEEYLRVGIKMHNCVYACNYFNKMDSLILLATCNGEIAELIEFDLTNLSVKQCRGKWNKQTPMHNKIISLLNSNKTLIA